MKSRIPDALKERRALVKVAFQTLGCKVNQYETEKMVESFAERGFDIVEFNDRADVYVINSCTVTRTADSKSRQAARSARHRNPDALVVLAGCYAETSPDAAGEVEGVSIVVGNAGKADIADRVAAVLSPEMLESLHPGRSLCARSGRTRAAVKIQDGCDQFCSYCAVPFARPVMYSRPSAEVRAELAGLAARGFREVVFAGIRLGRYLDDAGANLTDIVSAAAATPGIDRVRLSSIELTDIPDGLIELIADDRRVCRHLHIPLQSGDAGVLRRMNRPYAPGEFADFVERARRRVPGLAVTTDIMVGFPGETAGEFSSSMEFADRIGFSRAHIFRYSPRPGTAASKMKDDVPAAEKELRSKALIRLAGEHAGRFARSMIGEAAPVLIEGKSAGEELPSGFTDNYVRVEFEADGCSAGEIVDVRIESVSGGLASGTIVRGG